MLGWDKLSRLLVKLRAWLSFPLFVLIAFFSAIYDFQLNHSKDLLGDSGSEKHECVFNLSCSQDSGMYLLLMMHMVNACTKGMLKAHRIARSIQTLIATWKPFQPDVKSWLSPLCGSFSALLTQGFLSHPGCVAAVSFSTEPLARPGASCSFVLSFSGTVPTLQLISDLFSSSGK